MASPHLSIIVPTLNEEKYLPSLLTDLSHQIYRDFEVIIVDGRSDDATTTKAQHFAHRLPRLTIVSSDKRHVCYQRNLGAATAHAETLLFMDADNRLGPNFLLGLEYRRAQNKTDFFNVWVKSEDTDLTSQAIDTVINLYLELYKNSSLPFCVESMLGASHKQFQKLKGFRLVTPAEGPQLLRRATAQNMTFTVFKDPTYVYSMRRLKKLGTLGTLGRVAQAEIHRLLDIPIPTEKAKNLYPMKGGNFYEDESLRQNFFSHLLSKVKLQKQKERFVSLAKSFLLSNDISSGRE